MLPFALCCYRVRLHQGCIMDCMACSMLTLRETCNITYKPTDFPCDVGPGPHTWWTRAGFTWMRSDIEKPAQTGLDWLMMPEDGLCWRWSLFQNSVNKLITLTLIFQMAQCQIEICQLKIHMWFPYLMSIVLFALSVTVYEINICELPKCSPMILKLTFHEVHGCQLRHWMKVYVLHFSDFGRKCMCYNLVKREIQTDTHTHAQTYTYTHTRTHARTHACTHARTHTHTHKMPNWRPRWRPK